MKKGLARILILTGFIFVAAAIVVNSVYLHDSTVLAGSIDRKGNLRLLIKDKKTRAPLARREVEIYSDNGIRCITAPCPTNGIEWRGKTDSQGYVIVPKRIRQVSMTISIDGYVAEELNQASQKRSENHWIIALKVEQ